MPIFCKRRKANASAIILSILASSLVTGAAEQSFVPRLDYQVHWLANSSGRPEDHVQNFIEDMSVVNVPSKQYPRPLILTKSFWDEGHVPNGAYHNGKRVEKNWWLDSTDSRTARHGRDTCRIENFYGRAFLGKLPPPPSDISLSPKVRCTDGTLISSVVDPTAVAFDLAGNILVADNGPDQNVKIFRRTSQGPVLLRVFGVPGGVFAGPVKGAAGPRRFWGIRGLGVDSSGNIYVGNTGIPMQTMGGTDIRAFSAKDSSLLWQAQGLAFVNSADADPASGGTSLFLNAKRFEMDWSRDPGSSWKLAGVSLDPFRFPDDPRLQMPFEVAWVRRVDGQMFLYLTNMYSEYVAVYRSLPGEEIMVPSAFICAAWNGRELSSKYPWMDSIRPVVESSRGLSERWMWRDDNADGRVQRSEFRWFDLAYPYCYGIDVDDRGDIRLGGRVITKLVAGGLEKGIPRYSQILSEAVPFTEGNNDALRLKYLAGPDVMYLAGGQGSFPSFVHRYTNWSGPPESRGDTRIEIPYRDLGPDVNPVLDVNTENMLLPAGMTADTSFLYVVYGDRGPDGSCVDLMGMFTGTKGGAMSCRAEVSVFDAHTGARVGWMAVDSSVGWYSGAIDIPHPINVAQRPNGERIVLVEEDGKGKVLAYRWCPSGDASNCSSPIPIVPGSKPRWRRSSTPGWIDVRMDGDLSEARLMDMRGRTVGKWSQGSFRAIGGSWISLPLPADLSGLLMLELRSSSGTNSLAVALLK